MMPKGNEKREIQQNPLPLSPARSEKGNEKQRNPRNPLPFSACEAGKGNQKRETQQNPMPLPPARSEKGNQNRGNPRNPLPLKQVWLPKGNQKREIQQNPMPLPPARSEKGNKNRGNPRNPLPHSCFPQKGKKRKGSDPKKAPNKRPQTTRQPHLGAAALLYILSAITADHIFSKSSEFSRMDPTSLRWRNRGSKC